MSVITTTALKGLTMTSFHIRNSRHVTMSSIMKMLNDDRFMDYMAEELRDNLVSFGCNSNTLVEKTEFMIMMESVLCDIPNEGTQMKGFLILKDLKDLKGVKYISLGC
jgi:hypothetical protein